MSVNNCVRLFADHGQINNCKEKINKRSDAFADLANVLTLTGNEVRLKIVYLLEEETELCPCDLAEILEMSNPAISQHLKKLKEGNMVKTRKVGQTIYYSLRDAHLETLQPLLKQINQQSSKNVTV